MKSLRILLVVGMLVPELLYAQSFYAVRRERSIIGSIGTGVSSYFGELKEEKRSIDSKLNINVGLKYYFTNRISVRSELTWFQLHGDDSEAKDQDRVYRNLDFTANNFELNATGAVDLFPAGQRFYQRPKLNLYGFAGIGLLYSNPKTEYQGKKYALQSLQTEGVKYSRFQAVIPYGFGARVMLTPFVNIALEAGYRLTFTDYLDDVSTVHLDPSAFTDPIAAALSDRRPEVGQPIAAPGTRRGNPEKNDSYLLINAKLEYYIPDGVFWNTSKKLYKSKRKAYYRKRRR
jgi:hypothetical protein